jgi:hypothetical protein
MATPCRFGALLAALMGLVVPFSVPAEEFKEPLPLFALTTRYDEANDSVTVMVENDSVSVRFMLDRADSYCEAEVATADAAAGDPEALAGETKVLYRTDSAPCSDAAEDILATIASYLEMDDALFIAKIAKHTLITAGKAPYLKEREVMEKQDRDDLSIDLKDPSIGEAGKGKDP